MSLILYHLYLGGHVAAKELGETIPELYVINATRDLPFYNREAARRFRVAVEDNGSEEAMEIMRNALSKVTRLIHDQRSQGIPVLVHCFAGAQRSCAIVAAYLLTLPEFNSLKEVIDFMQIMRREAFFWRVNFLRPLQEWAAICGKNNTWLEEDPKDSLPYGNPLTKYDEIIKLDSDSG